MRKPRPKRTDPSVRIQFSHEDLLVVISAMERFSPQFHKSLMKRLNKASAIWHHNKENQDIASPDEEEPDYAVYAAENPR